VGLKGGIAVGSATIVTSKDRNLVIANPGCVPQRPHVRLVEGVRMCEHVGGWVSVWVCTYVGVWVCGCASMWVCGCVSVRACGCMGV
jgi:hypothetical protein